MRVAVLAAVLLALGCGHKVRSENRTVATLPDTGGTPVWLGVANGQVVVAMTHRDVDAGLSLVSINPATGEVHQLAGSVPVGAFSVQDGNLYDAVFLGEIGSVDLSSGAYTKLMTTDGNAYAVAAVPHGYIIGMSGHVELYGADGTHHAVAGSDIGASGDFKQIVTTRAGVFAASQLGGVVLRIDGDHATVVADHQQVPGELAATQTHLVWTTGEGTNVGQHLVAMPLAGGAITRLADAAAPALIAHVATTDTQTACSTAAGHKGEILTVKPGAAPKTQVAADARLLALSGDTLYWVEETTSGWTVHAAPLKS